MDLAGTRAAIRKAETEEVVFALVQQYLQEMPDTDFESMPDAFRAHLIRTADDVSRWALYFNREDLTVPPEQSGRTVLREMVLLFTAAAWRLAEIAHLKIVRKLEKT
jgi:hypothetical protein